MQTLNVDLGDRSYPIHIGQNLISNADLILPYLKRKQVAICKQHHCCTFIYGQIGRTIACGRRKSD